MLKTSLTLVVVVLIAIGGYVFLKGNPGPAPLGSTPGPDHYESQFFQGGLTYGNGCYATTTTGTMQASTFLNNSCIRIAAAGAGQGVISLTLPATTTLSALIPTVGSCRDWWIDASAVAAATTTTFVAGTGHNVIGLDATGAGTGADVLDGAEYGRLTMCREADSDVATFVTEWIHAD